MNDIRIEELTSETFPQHVDALTDILHAVVLDGASVGFILPFPREQSEAFWRERIGPALKTGRRCLFIARAKDAVAGTVQLDHDLSPNQRHRAEVAKLLVHPAHRNRGIAKKLLARLEQRAQGLGRRLITLDTRSGDVAEALYRAQGYQVAGRIPGYCRAPEAERLDPTTYMFKQL